MGEDGKLIGALFESHHPLAQLAKEHGARLAVNPHVMLQMLTENNMSIGSPIVSFVRTVGSQTELVPISIENVDYVGIALQEKKEEPIKLENGQSLAKLPIAAIVDFLQQEVESAEAIEQPTPSVAKSEKPVVHLPKLVQEVNMALSSQSPKLGKLEIRPSNLSKKMFTIHQQDTPDNGLTSVSMYMVEKLTKSAKGKIKKTSSNRHVVGFYLPTEKELENPEKMILGIEELKRKLTKRKHKSGTVASFGMEDEIELAIVTPKQIEVWRKTNYFTELVAYKDKAVSLERVYKLISKQLGEGVETQVQHITNGEADLVFVPEGARLPSELSAFDVAISGEDEETEYLQRVVGIMCVPDGMSEKEKKQLAGKVSKSLRLLYTSKSFAGKMPNILAVDSSLLKYWESRVNNNELVMFPHESKKIASRLVNHEERESVGSADVEDIDFYTFEPNKAGIGAKFMQLIVKYGDGHEERLTLDQGAQFDNFPWDGISKPSFASGIEAFLPYLPSDQVKFWRRTLELRQAEEQGARFFVPENAIANDLALRVGLDMFTQLANQVGYPNAATEIPKIFGNLTESKVHHLGVVYTHGHVDHFGWGGLLSTNIPVITTDHSIPFFQTMFLAGSGGFASEAIFRRERNTLLTQASRRIFTPPMYLPEPYQEIRLGRGQVGITLLPVSHSIYGGVMAKVVIYDKSDKPIKTIVYTGDYNFDNKAMMDETEEYLRDADVLVTDTTNIRPNAYGKPSVGVTREIMGESFRKALLGKDKSSIIEMAWHNIQDVDMIQKIAAEVGENVYVYPKMAILLHLLHQLDETRQKSVQAYDWSGHNPIPRLGADVLPWIYPKMTYKKGERMLIESMDVANHASLSDAKQHILFVPPNPMLRQTMLGSNIGQYSQAIRAHYWPYGSNDKEIVRKNALFAREHNLDYLSDLELRGGHIYPSSIPKYHMSGHGRPEDSLAMIKRMADNGVLRQVVPIHGDSRAYAAQRIREQHPGLQVYDRFQKNGFTISLFSKSD